MQPLEDKHIIDSGEMAERIAVLRGKVQELLENSDTLASSEAHSKYNDELVEENIMLKKQLVENKEDTSLAILNNLEEENTSLKKEIDELNNRENISSNDEIVQENIMLKKQLDNRKTTIKELDLKLEMLKLPKSLREETRGNIKSDELKKIITEYIKEIDKSIASLNIE
tara:strand:- start:1059 stop:1568 length:510 start_codon:yes stop_codon:yes gene_type:complete